MRQRASILPILVLYNLRLSDSPAYRTFCASASHCGSDPCCIAVYDNSQVRHVDPEQKARLYAFHHDPSNGALAAAYNWALSVAAERGIEWLLLLDQDTELPLPFVGEINAYAALYAGPEQVAAVVPHVRGGESQLSPRFVRLARTVNIPDELTGIVPRSLTAINSGTLIKISFLESIGGFNTAYPLDSLDHWLFNKIYARGFFVAVSPLQISHSLSVTDYRRSVSLTRYQSILSSEALFMATEKPPIERALYVIRLMVRAIKQVAIYRRARIAAATGLSILSFVLGRSRQLSEGSR